MNYNGLRKLSYFLYIDHERLQMSFMTSQRCSYVQRSECCIVSQRTFVVSLVVHTHLVSWMCLGVKIHFHFILGVME